MNEDKKPDFHTPGESRDVYSPAGLGTDKAWLAPTRGGATTTTSVAAGSNGQVYSTVSGAVAWKTVASTSASPADPTVITNDGTTRMAGLGVLITPAISGIVTVTFAGKGTGDLTNQIMTLQVAYGSGSAPSNAAAATGTTVGNTAVVDGNIKFNWCLPVRVTGLTPGTAYWLDLQVNVTSGAGGASSGPSKINCHAVEVA